MGWVAARCRSAGQAPTARSRASPSTAPSTRPIVADAGARRHLSRWRRIPITVRTAFEARWPHSASSSMLLAPETAAHAHTSRIAVNEYHRPRRARGSGTESKYGRRSAIRPVSSGPGFTSTAGMGEDAAAGTGHLMIIGLRHHNDHEARACSAMRPNRSQPDQPHDPGTCNRPGVIVATLVATSNSIVSYRIRQFLLAGLPRCGGALRL